VPTACWMEGLGSNATAFSCCLHIATLSSSSVLVLQLIYKLINGQVSLCYNPIHCYTNLYLFTGNFQRIFVCPLHSRTTFQQLRRIVAADGTFLTGRFVLTLLLAVGIDANGHNVILAWAVVESENRDSWECFLRLLRRCIPEIASEPCVFISDREKSRCFQASIISS